MNILAIDTCWSACSAAIGTANEGGPARLLAHRFEAMDTGQAEMLPVMLSEVFASSGVSATELDRIAVPFGPGSFTGVRIGVAAARALKLAAEAEIVACSSLEVIAHQLVRRGLCADVQHFIVAMDARRSEAYVQDFQCAGTTVKSGAPKLLKLADVVRLCRSDRFNVAGSAAPLLKEAADEAGRDLNIIVENIAPDAGALLDLAPSLAPFDSPLRPLYLRPPDAKPPAAKPVTRI